MTYYILKINVLQKNIWTCIAHNRCQIIAHALGGEVDYNPNKLFFLKAETLKLRQPDFSNLLAVVAGSKNTRYLYVIVNISYDIYINVIIW